MATSSKIRSKIKSDWRANCWAQATCAVVAGDFFQRSHDADATNARSLLYPVTKAKEHYYYD